jgi:UDP-N-acetylglucosamine 3-dehydrogenase
MGRTREMSEKRGAVSIGVVSYAHLHAPRYAAAIAAHPQARLAGIATLGLNAGVARAEAERYGVPYYDEYETLLAQPGLQAVYLGSTPVQHWPVVARAAAYGRHVLCDKPIATTLAEADTIVQTARQAGVKLMVPFNPRFQLPLIAVKQALESGAAGELVAIYAVKYGRLPSKASGPQEAGWFLDPAQAGGGGFLDIGIHAVDGLRWLAGAEARRVYAHVGTLIHPDLASDDLGVMTVEFDNGVVAVLSAGWANPDGYPTWLDVRFEILTTKQIFLIKSPYHDFTVYSGQRTERRYWWRRDVDGLVDDFVQAILQDREPAITGEDGRAALAIALAAYESARRREVVTLSG